MHNSDDFDGISGSDLNKKENVLLDLKQGNLSVACPQLKGKTAIVAALSDRSGLGSFSNEGYGWHKNVDACKELASASSEAVSDYS